MAYRTKDPPHGVYFLKQIPESTGRYFIFCREEGLDKRVIFDPCDPEIPSVSASELLLGFESLPEAYSIVEALRESLAESRF